MSIIFAAVLMAQVCPANKPCNPPSEVARFVKQPAQYCQPTADFWNKIALSVRAESGASVTYFCVDVSGKEL